MFPVHNLNMKQTQVIFGFAFGEKNFGQGNHVLIAIPLLPKSFVFKTVFYPAQDNDKPQRFHHPFKSVFEKLRFRNGLVWTVGLAYK